MLPNTKNALTIYKSILLIFGNFPTKVQFRLTCIFPALGNVKQFQRDSISQPIPNYDGLQCTELHSAVLSRQRLRGARKKCNLYLEVDRYYIFTCQVREMNLRQVQKLAATKTFSDMNGQHNRAKPLLKVAQTQTVFQFGSNL